MLELAPDQVPEQQEQQPQQQARRSALDLPEAIASYGMPVAVAVREVPNPVTGATIRLADVSSEEGSGRYWGMGPRADGRCRLISSRYAG